MSITQQLIDISVLKGEIRTSILNKGVSLDSSAQFSTYPGKIDSISAAPATTYHIGTGFSNIVYSITADSSNHLYASGAFTTYKDVSQNYLARLNSDGSKDTTFDIGTGFNGGIQTTVIDSSNNIYAGGSFTTFQGATQNRLIRLKNDGSKDISFDVSNGFNSTVYTMLLDSSNRLYVGGSFSTYKGSPQNYLVRLNNDGSKDTSFDISNGFAGTFSFQTEVYSLILDSSNKLYVGGEFLTYKGLNQKALVRLNSDGTKDTAFDVSNGFNNLIDTNCLWLDSSNRLYAGGQFSTYKGLPQVYLIRLNNDGSKDTTLDISTLNAGFNSIINSMFLDASNRLYVSGSFTTYKTLPQNRLIRINADGSKDTSFDVSNGFSSYIKEFVPDTSNHIYISGAFTTYWSIPYPYYTRYLMRIFTNGAIDTDTSNI